MHHKILAAMFVVILLSQLAWAATPTVSNDVRAVAKGNNEFAIDLYKRLRSDAPGNLFLSPYSISAALAMTSAGARGKTEQQMAEVLHFRLPKAKLHPAVAMLRQRLNAGNKDGFELRVANRLWGQQGFHFLPSFMQLARADYGAGLAQVDFERHAQAARKTINTWIEEQTQNKIQELIAPGVLGTDTRLVLTNAIYFKASWLDQFNEESTREAPFHVSETEQVKVPMMQDSRRNRYASFDDFQMLELPYALETASMLVLLPTKIDGLPNLEQQLTSENVEKWSSRLAYSRVNLYLPKFKTSATFQLNDVLTSLGMTLAFDPVRADFSGMSTQERLFLSAVVHKAFVDVNEEGTEAAAATAVEAKATSEQPEKPVEFRADHPFVFLIRDNQTSTILFLGRLVNPKQ